MKFRVTGTDEGYKVSVNYSMYNPFITSESYQTLRWDIDKNLKKVFNHKGVESFIADKVSAKDLIKDYLKSKVVILVEDEEGMGL